MKQAHRCSQLVCSISVSTWWLTVPLLLFLLTRHHLLPLWCSLLTSCITPTSGQEFRIQLAAWMLSLASIPNSIQDTGLIHCSTMCHDSFACQTVWSFIILTPSWSGTNMKLAQQLTYIQTSPLSMHMPHWTFLSMLIESPRKETWVARFLQPGFFLLSLPLFL